MSSHKERILGSVGDLDVYSFREKIMRFVKGRLLLVDSPDLSRDAEPVHKKKGADHSLYFIEGWMSKFDRRLGRPSYPRS